LGKVNSPTARLMTDEELKAHGFDHGELSESEETLLNNYRALSPEIREAVATFIEQLPKPTAAEIHKGIQEMLSKVDIRQGEVITGGRHGYEKSDYDFTNKDGKKGEDNAPQN
jgi:5,10-methenyltetrahydromethanopterin hydrogenase